MKSQIKITRNKNEMLKALKEHLSILKDAINKVNNRDFKYSKIIASTLRVLVCETKNNIPLLLKIADENNFIPMVDIDGPPHIKRSVSLKNHLEDIYFMSETKQINLKNKDFILKTSQQEGGSHEDWSLDIDYFVSKGNGLLMGGLPPNILKLKILGKHVYKAGLVLLNKLEGK